MRLAHARQGLNNAVAYLRNEIQVKNVIASETDRTISWVGRTTGILKGAVSYTHLRAHETVLDLVCRLLLEKKKTRIKKKKIIYHINTDKPHTKTDKET